MTMAQIDEDGQAVITETGIRCGNGGSWFRHYHANAATVKACYQISRDEYDQQTAEIEAEKRVERFYEEGF